MSKDSERLYWVPTLVLLVLALTTIAATAHSSWLVTHITGLLVMLAELLREGTFYPPVPNTELVYSTYYQPLAFAPLALLPGHGLAMIPGLRWLVGIETLSALLATAMLARTAGLSWRAACQPAAWALCTMPCAFALVGMRDDPRAALFCIMAMAVLARQHRLAPELAGALLALGFFTKITSPAAPGLAALWLASRQGAPRLLRFVAAVTVATVVPFAVLQWGLGADLLGIVIRSSILEPAFTPRPIGVALHHMLADLLMGELESWAAIPLIAVSTVALCVRLPRRKVDAFDILVLGTWLKTLVVYRHPGTDLNHLIDLILALAVHASVRTAGLETPLRSLLWLLLLYGLGRPHELVLAGRGAPPLAQSPAAQVAAALRAAPANGPTLAEDPLVALEANLFPRVPDPSSVDSLLRRNPGITATWFGDKGHPGALQRIVLMRDPFERSKMGDPADWYGVVAFGPGFLPELRAHWGVVLRSDAACVLERR